MSNENRYQKEVGHISKSGKSIVRISKSGRKYYMNPNRYVKKPKKFRTDEEKGLWLNRKDDISTRVKPYCYDKDSAYYMRFWDKKCEIRNQYPKWIHMSREECREYYAKIWDLIQNDEDYQLWKEETKTIEERMKDQFWKDKNERDSEYDGHNDEYDWK